jgi:hypothetical protein
MPKQNKRDELQAFKGRISKLDEMHSALLFGVLEALTENEGFVKAYGTISRDLFIYLTTGEERPTGA